MAISLGIALIVHATYTVRRKIIGCLVPVQLPASGKFGSSLRVFTADTRSSQQTRQAEQQDCLCEPGKKVSEVRNIFLKPDCRALFYHCNKYVFHSSRCCGSLWNSEPSEMGKLPLHISYLKICRWLKSVLACICCIRGFREKFEPCDRVDFWF